MDAIDALLCFGYKVRKGGGFFGHTLFVDYLLSQHADSVNLLLEEIKVSPEYYKNRLTEVAIP
tara:strand:+ start:219 stop:407 length:189 start_codon:yes stop_codon:yes gene_type:complete